MNTQADSHTNGTSLGPVQIKKLVRQHVHDVRNYVNCVNMEIALMEDDIKETPFMEGMESMRNQLHELDKLLVSFQKNFAEFPDQ